MRFLYKYLLLLALLLGLNGVSLCQVSGCEYVKKQYPLIFEFEPDTGYTQAEVVYPGWDTLQSGSGMSYMIIHHKGELTGPAQFKDYQGRLYVKGSFKKNQKNGFWIYYHEYGSWKECGNYSWELTNTYYEIDCDIRPFLHPDSIANLQNTFQRSGLGILPYLCIVDRKELGRVGDWVTYDQFGKILKEMTYENGKMISVQAPDISKAHIWKNVEYVGIKAGIIDTFSIPKEVFYTNLNSHFVLESFNNKYPAYTNFPKWKEEAFYALATKPVTTDIDTLTWKKQDYLVYRYHVKNCYEDGPHCYHGHSESHNVIYVSPEFGKIVEILGFAFTPIYSIRNSANSPEEYELLRFLQRSVLDRHEDIDSFNESYIDPILGIKQ